MDMQQSEIEEICDIIEYMADRYHTHPDPIARRYGALQAVGFAIMSRMTKINNKNRDGNGENKCLR
jgi:hypothetical protein